MIKSGLVCIWILSYRVDLHLWESLDPSMITLITISDEMAKMRMREGGWRQTDRSWRMSFKTTKGMRERSKETI